MLSGTELDDTTYDSHSGQGGWAGGDKEEAPADKPILLEDLPEQESPKTLAAAADASNGGTAAEHGSGKAGQEQTGARQQQGGVRWAGNGSSGGGGSEEGEGTAGQKGAAVLDNSTRSGRLLRAMSNKLSMVFGGGSRKGD